VHLERPFLAPALGVDVAVEVVVGDAAVEDLDAAELDDAVAETGVQAGGFRIEHDAAHQGKPNPASGVV